MDHKKCKVILVYGAQELGILVNNKILLNVMTINKIIFQQKS